MGTVGGYHDKCGGRSLGKQLNLYGNPSVLNIPWCIHDIPHTHRDILTPYQLFYGLKHYNLLETRSFLIRKLNQPTSCLML